MQVGRTGRAGHTGYAFTFVNRSNWQEISGLRVWDGVGSTLFGTIQVATTSSTQELQWAHDYLLGVLQATEQNVDETLQASTQASLFRCSSQLFVQEAIDAHLKAASLSVMLCGSAWLG